ncbi:hypothetical protein [Burkholderia savannae]|uniref:hypothetical protein n=1 Tax=Burkholderia savannae TaxID=1637837 RepID=UPI000B2176E9|nr:hypothetical protein [Burkholderia savannae]
MLDTGHRHPRVAAAVQARLAHVRNQLPAADALDASLPWTPITERDNRLAQAGPTVAIAWRFTRMMLPAIVDETAHPHLTAFSASAEDTPLFAAFPLT